MEFHEVANVPTDKLEAHPDNPRLVMREDVIESIVAQLADSGHFDPAHALLVRTTNGGYQILQGHHRAEAARRAGIKEVPCWVREMGDDEAYMQLALGNSQGELSPLEYGVHVLGLQAYKNGGMRAYAKSVGKDNGNLTKYRDAAEVLKNVCTSTNISEFLDKSLHLAAIQKADKSLWGKLVDKMLAVGWSAADTSFWVERVNEFDIPDKWAEIFLPLPSVVERFLDSREFSPTTVTQLVKIAEAIEVTIDASDVDRSKHKAEFHLWLTSGAGDYSWDVRNLQKYLRELDVRLEAETLQLRSAWNLGRWQDHIDKVADNSVALLLTDPPYGIGYQSDYRLDRREERRNDQIVGDDDSAADMLQEMLIAMRPKLKDSAHVFVFCHWSNESEIRNAILDSGLDIRGSLIWVKNNTGMGDVKTTFAPQHERIIHAVKGSPILFERQSDVLVFDRVNSEHHPSQKPIDLLKRLIDVSTVTGEIVADPFGGVASSLIAAKDTGRVFWGCEINKEYYDHGLVRLTK